MSDNFATIKAQHRQELARLPFEMKIAILIRMQKMAREMATAAGREFTGVVWREDPMIAPPAAKARAL